MKLFVLGTCVLAAAVTAGVAAQGGATNEQTIMGCVKGDGTDANPWTLAGVFIPPPPPAAPAGGGRGAGGARGGGRGEAAPAAPAARGGAGGGRAAGPAAPTAQSFKLNGINMTPWAGGRAEVTGTGTTGGFNVTNVRSMWGTCQ